MPLNDGMPPSTHRATYVLTITSNNFYRNIICPYYAGSPDFYLLNYRSAPCLRASDPRTGNRRRTAQSPTQCDCSQGVSRAPHALDTYQTGYAPRRGTSRVPREARQLRDSARRYSARRDSARRDSTPVRFPPRRSLASISMVPWQLNPRSPIHVASRLPRGAGTSLRSSRSAQARCAAPARATIRWGRRESSTL